MTSLIVALVLALSAQPSIVDQLIAATTDGARAAVLDAHASEVTEDLQRALSVKATDFRRVGKFEEAGRSYLAMRDVARRRGDEAALASVLIAYAGIPGQKGEYPEALAVLADAKTIAERLHSDPLL